MATINETTRRFQTYTASIQMQTLATKMGKNGEIQEMVGPPQLLPVSFRWEVPSWRPQEVDMVQNMFQITAKLAGDKMDIRELVEHLFKRMKELFPGRNLIIAAAFFVMENKVEPVTEKLIL